MARIKFDVSGSDPDKAAGGSFEQPKPGVYKFKVHEIVLGYKKDDNGKPDKSQPRLEVTAECLDKRYKGARLYDYIGFTESVQWKMDQFLQAFGIADKKKRKGSFDTDTIVGEPCLIRVKGETYNDEYRAKVGAWLPARDDDDEDDADLEDDLEPEEEDEEEPEEEDEEPEEAADEDEEPRYYDLSELQGMTIDGLKQVAEDLEIEDLPATKLVKKMAQYIYDNQPGDPFEATAEEEEEEEEPEAEDDGYDELDLAELKAELKERGLKTVGVKAALIKRLREADAEGPF